MRLAPGTRLGPYEVVAQLGAGGMGEVYRARDTKLDRDVALKILPESFANDGDRLMRFEREAKTLATLNHPRIAQIHGFEQSGSLSALVMELVEGEDLAQRIARGAIPVDEALSIAQQIADALAAAHVQRIIHRDLKPANVKVRPDGTVKVLDFGLAKALEGAAASGKSGGDEVLHSPTFTSPAMTAAGLILGTAAYMAPEQARGKAVDERADIWALGVTLFEMLSGQTLFGEETMSDTLAAVLRKPIEWSRLPAGLPASVHQLLRLCLERDPAKRLRHAADVRVLIDAAAQEESVVPATPPVASTTARRWASVALLAAAAAAGALAMWAVTGRLGAPSIVPTVRFTVTPPPARTISNVALSADGSVLAYVATNDAGSDIYLYRLERGESEVLPGTSGARWLFVSPDGKWIGFFRDNKLHKISVNGGEAITLCDAAGGPGAVWLPDGRIVFSVSWLTGLSVVSGDGGAPSALTTINSGAGETGHWWPALGPDGSLLFSIFTAGGGIQDSRIARADLLTGEHRVLFPGARPYWLSSGHVVFYRAGRYHAAALDADANRIAADPVPVFPDAVELDPTGDWRQHVVVSPSGSVAYVPGKLIPESKIAWITKTGQITPLGIPTRSYVDLSLSPDGRRAALSTFENGRLRLRIADLERGTDAPLDMPGMSWRGVWHPDNRRLAFTSLRRGDFDVFIKDLSGGEPEQPLIDDREDASPTTWTSDGALIFYGSDPDGRYLLKLRDARDPSKIQTLTGSAEGSAALSPDGKWLAFTVRRDGRRNISVQRFPRAGPEVHVSRNGGVDPLFAADGRTLYFVRGASLLAASWREVDGRFVTDDERVIAADAVWRNPEYQNGYGIAPDGRVLSLVLAEPLKPARITVVMGFRP